MIVLLKNVYRYRLSAPFIGLVNGIVAKVDAVAFYGSSGILGGSYSITGNIQLRAKGDNARIDRNNASDGRRAGRGGRITAFI